MKLYYTGAKESGDAQPDPQKSLGGFVSSSFVNNGELGNLFSEISQYTIEKKLREIVGLVLVNESGSTKTGITLWFEYPSGAYAKMKVAIVQLTENIDGDSILEKVANRRSLPYYATFYEANGEDNALSLPDMLADAKLGIWLVREIDTDAVNALTTDETLLARFAAGETLNTEELVHLKIDWTA